MKIALAFVLAVCFIIIIMEIKRWSKNLKEGDKLEREKMKLDKTEITSALLQTRRSVLKNDIKNAKTIRELGGISSQMDEMINNIDEKVEPYELPDMTEDTNQP